MAHQRLAEGWNKGQKKETQYNKQKKTQVRLTESIAVMKVYTAWEGNGNRERERETKEKVRVKKFNEGNRKSKWISAQSFFFVGHHNKGTVVLPVRTEKSIKK